MDTLHRVTTAAVIATGIAGAAPLVLAQAQHQFPMKSGTLGYALGDP